MPQAVFLGYYRCSTDRQGRSGLGLDAQRNAVHEFLKNTGGQLLDELTEIESGRRKDRPELLRALEICRRTGAVLLIGKLDRLVRNVAFISALLESRVKFIAVDMPEADVTFLQMAAVFGEWEARKIGERTKAALAAAKARGKQLGWAMPSRLLEQRAAAEKGGRAASVQAEQFARNVLPVVSDIRKSGIATLDGVAQALNARGIRTRRGGTWHAATVRNLTKYAQSPPPTGHS